MDRREMLGIMGASAAGFLAVGGGAARADHERGKHDEHIEMFGKCAKLCAESASHCLDVLCKGEGNREAHARALEMAAGCEEFCKLTAGLMACDSPLKHYAMAACGHACHDCAEACEKAGGDQIMAECVKKCRECAEMCHKMHSEHGGDHHSAASR
jgi:hypothetical protein